MEIERDVPGLFIAKSTDGSIFALGGALFGLGFSLVVYFSYTTLAEGSANAFIALISLALIFCGVFVSAASSRIRIVAETESGKISVWKNSILSRKSIEFRFSDIDRIRYGVESVDVPAAYHVCLEIRARDGKTKTIRYPAGPDLDRERWIAAKLATMAGVKIVQ